MTKRYHTRTYINIELPRFARHLILLATVEGTQVIGHLIKGYAVPDQQAEVNSVKSNLRRKRYQEQRTWAIRARYMKPISPRCYGL